MDHVPDSARRGAGFDEARSRAGYSGRFRFRFRSRGLGAVLGSGLALAAVWIGGWSGTARGLEPEEGGVGGAGRPWSVSEIRPGMRGAGRTVMRGTRLETFEAEVLGVMRDVSPGRDMILCRLRGCDLEHSGIIQGMSGSPIEIDGRLLGAVAYAWEFAKDPIAGVTPYEQMVKFARPAAAGAAAAGVGVGGGGRGREGAGGDRISSAAGVRFEAWLPGLAGGDSEFAGKREGAAEREGAAGPGWREGGMRAIAAPLSATGFSERGVALLRRGLEPMGMAPMAAGSAPEYILRESETARLEAGSPMSVGLVVGDFDLSAIGTVTRVEGERVYGFGHPMFGLGSCELPMMTGYIHTVFPRASVSMKMGSPMRIVGTLDSDVSTGVSGRLGAEPRMIPMTARVRIGPWSEEQSFRARLAREPRMLSSLLTSALTSALDAEGNLPEEFTARLRGVIRVRGLEPIAVEDWMSGPRYAGVLGAGMMFGGLTGAAGLLARNPFEAVEFEGIDCALEIEPVRRLASIEGVRLERAEVPRGGTLRAHVTLKPYKRERVSVLCELEIPESMPEGTHELLVCDLDASLRRLTRNAPHLGEPGSFEELERSLRIQTGGNHRTIHLHAALPDQGVVSGGRALPRLPSSVRAMLTDARAPSSAAIREDLTGRRETEWVVEGSRTTTFRVVAPSGFEDED